MFFKIKIKWIVTYSMLYRQRLTFSTVEPFVPSIAAIHTRSINVMALFGFQTIATWFGAVFSKHLVITFWYYRFVNQLLLKVWLVCMVYNPTSFVSFTLKNQLCEFRPQLSALFILEQVWMTLCYSTPSIMVFTWDQPTAMNIENPFIE